ncbi:tail fiber protein [Caudoviricetes sp.]|nr:tail fiber protein [Caudoviricetes sp.]
MTLSSIVPPLLYLTDGVTKSFPITFDILPTDGVVVTLTDRSVAPNDAQTIDSDDYTIVYTPDGISSKATLTYPKTGSAVVSGYYLTIDRLVPYTQPVNLVNQSGYNPEKTELALDILGKQIQQLAGLFMRCIQLPVGSITPPEEYLEQLQSIMIEARNAADRAEAVEVNLPNALFRDVLTTSSASLTLNESYNGCILAVTPAIGGTTITLPSISGRETNYQVAIRNMTGTYDVLVVTSSGEKINYKNGSDTGVTSLELNEIGADAIFAADRTGATSEYWVTSGFLEDNGINLSKIQKIGSNKFLANTDAVSNVVAEVSLDYTLQPLLANLLTGFNNFTASSYTLNEDHRGHLINLNRASGNMQINLPEINTVGEPYVIMVRRASGTDTVSLARSGSVDQFSAGASDGTLSNTFAIDTTVGATYIIYGVKDSSVSYANRWIPIRLA